MFGFGDFSIFAAFALCILSAVACVVYGIINWNKAGDEQVESTEEWDKGEKDMTDKLDI